MTELRRNKSMAKAELKRLRSNRKEGMLGDLFCWTCELHGKEKDAVTESKSRVFRGGGRQSDARSLNCQFTQDTRQVYTKFEMMCKGEDWRHRYQGNTNISSHGDGGNTYCGSRAGLATGVERGDCDPYSTSLVRVIWGHESSSQEEKLEYTWAWETC